MFFNTGKTFFYYGAIFQIFCILAVLFQTIFMLQFIKQCLLLLVFLFFVSNIFSQEDSTKKKKDLPYILFEKITHDFGTLEYGSDATYEFVFKNVGRQPLIIMNCQSSCGCTVPDCPKDPIKKNEVGKIKVKYNTTNIGSFSKTITIQSNALNNPVVLTVKGKVKSKDESKTNP